VAAAGAGCEAGPEVGTVVVLETLPHDTAAYTQGLVLHRGYLYESTGRYGSSSLRRIDPATGEVQARVPLSEELFGEGLAVVDGRLVQLTWREGVALVYDPATLEVRDTLELPGDGWGLCHDGGSLYQTDGSSILWIRDPATLETRDQLQVRQDDAPLQQVNELECVGDHILANVFQSDEIVRIDKATGEVVARYDASALVPEIHRGSPEAVLNGIAWDPDTDTYYLTGKLWPVLYRVRLLTPGATAPPGADPRPPGAANPGNPPSSEPLTDTSWSRVAPTPPGDSLLRVEGTVRRREVEGGVWVVEDRAGESVEPLNLPADFRTEGLEVEMEVRPRDDMASMGMAGRLVEIVRIRTRPAAGG
jgi:glutamine cyclotransferase